MLYDKYEIFYIVNWLCFNIHCGPDSLKEMVPPWKHYKFSPLYLSFRVYMTSHSLSNSINIYADYIISIWHFLCYLTEYDYNTHMVKELCRLFNHVFAFVITRFLNCEHLILQKTIFLFYILRIFINHFSS